MTALLVAPSEPGLYDDVDEAVYHADARSLSQSGAKVLLECPAIFHYQQTHPAEPSEAMEFGSALHKLVLGVGTDVVVVDAEDWRTKLARELRDAARKAGKVPLLAERWAQAQEMAARVWDKPAAARLLSGGKPEVSAYAVDEHTGVMRRGRFDYLRDDLVVDYKTAATADPDEWRRWVVTHGYHIQHPWYVDLARDCGVAVRGLVFVVQQKTPPYLVTCVELVPSAVELGRDRARLALEMYRDCTETGVWPDYAEEIVALDLPDWYYRAHYAQEAS